MLYLRQRADIYLDGLKVAILTLKTQNVQDSRKNLKMKTGGITRWRSLSDY